MQELTVIFANLSAFIEAHESYAYPILFLGSYFETLIGVGFFVYGELFFIPGALLAGGGVLNIWLVALSLILGGVLGDATSYYIGRRYGASFFKEHHRVFNHTNYQKGLAFFDKYGPKSVFLSRLLGPVSWITPFLAGVYRLPYRTFLPYNLAGVTVGIGQFLVVGYFFGSNYEAVMAVVRDKFVLIFALALVLGFSYWIVRRNRA